MASHIAGTAAFLAGFTVQDQPLYGAERRGAPITAFIRISDESVILERGHANNPAILVVADESLLEEKAATSLIEGLDESGILFFNTHKELIELREIVNVKSTTMIIAKDLTHFANEVLGNPLLIGAAIAGVTARLLGIDYKYLEEAATLELEKLGIDVKKVQNNLTLAKVAYESIEFPSLGEQRHLEQPRRSSLAQSSVIELTYQGPTLSTCTITAPANTVDRKVGKWSTYKPLIDHDRCTKCMICFVYCPDTAITIDQTDNRFPKINYDVCKGCDICYTECPVGAISITRREKN